MHLLITGSTGFVGQNLTRYLSDSSFQVYGLNREDDPNVFCNYLWSNAEVIPFDDIDIVIHATGRAHDVKNIILPEEYHKINVLLTRDIFNKFLLSRCRTFIFISSVAAVLDIISDTALTEGIVEHPSTPYGKSKLEAEQYILSQSLPTDKRVFILRPPMIYGPGNKGNLNLLYRFVTKGIPYPLGAFDNRRSFLSVHNLCYVIRQLIEKDTIPSGIYNVADDDPVSTNEIIALMAAALHRKPHIWKLPKGAVNTLANMGDRLHLPLNTIRLKKLTSNYLVSNEKIKKAIGIDRLPVAVKVGLAETFEHFKEQPSIR